MARTLSALETLVALGVANIVLGLAIVGVVAIVFGIALLVLAAAFALYLWMRSDDATRPHVLSFPTAAEGRASIEEAASELMLNADEWVNFGGMWTLRMEGLPIDGEPFRIDCTMTESARAELRLSSDAAQQDTLFGIVPVGPLVPYGVDEFLRLVQALGGGTPFTKLVSHAATAPLLRSMESSSAGDASPVRARQMRSMTRTPEAAHGSAGRFCRVCGREFGAGGRFCVGCGAERQTAVSAPGAFSPEPIPDVGDEDDGTTLSGAAVEGTGGGIPNSIGTRALSGCAKCGAVLLDGAAFCIECGGSSERSSSWT